jgi:hypothetical protein
MIRLRFARSGLCVAALAVLVPLAANAQQPPAPAPADRLLLLVDAATDPASAEREARFLEELALVLDGVAVERIDLGPDFAALPLADQLVRMGPAAAERKAAAALWIRDPGPGRVLLHLVVLSAGRALVRVVEIDSGAVTEAGLALAARELIREAHVLDLSPSPSLPQPQPAPGPAPAAAPCPAVTPPSRRPEWGLAVQAVANGGAAAYAGPSLQFGALIGAEWQPLDGLFSRLSLSGKAGPRAETHDGIVTGWGLELALAAGYDWRIGPIAAGPFVSVSGSRTAVDMALGTGDRRSFSWWSFRGAAGLDLRVPLGRRAALVAEGGVGGIPNQSVFKRRSDKSTILSTPHLDWSASLGVVVFLDLEP